MANEMVKARRAYNEVNRMLNDIIDNIKENIDNPQDFSGEDFLIDFDCILQYALLDCALSDDDLDFSELMYMRDLTTHGDLIDCVDDDEFTSWADLFDATEDEVDLWMERIFPAVKEMAQSFAHSFAFCSAITDTNYFDAFVVLLRDIFSALVMADGMVTDEELDAYSDNSIHHIFDMIIKLIRYYYDDIKSADGTSDGEYYYDGTKSTGGTSDGGGSKSL